jgi:hypothetical protein
MPRGTPEHDAPEAVRKALIRIGGLNPHGKPMWRVCLAQNCVRKSEGIVHHLPTGEVSVFDVDPRGEVHGKSNLASKVESGMFELPRYGCGDGWIIERWFPAEIWGTPETWNSHRAADGGRILADEYPRFGDYYMTNLQPFESLPELGDLENAIQMWEHEHRNRPTNILTHYKQQMAAEEELREKRRQKLEDDLSYMRKNELVPVLKSGSLAAQSVRNSLQKMIGDSSHLGVVLNP